MSTVPPPMPKTVPAPAKWTSSLFGAPDALCAVFAAVFLCGILLCNIFLPYITI